MFLGVPVLFKPVDVPDDDISAVLQEGHNLKKYYSLIGTSLPDEHAYSKLLLKAVLWIRDILVWIRMRIRVPGSVPMSYESGRRSGRPKNIRIIRIWNPSEKS
jgi:hypothetical protein